MTPKMHHDYIKLIDQIVTVVIDTPLAAAFIAIGTNLLPLAWMFASFGPDIASFGGFLGCVYMASRIFFLWRSNGKNKAE